MPSSSSIFQKNFSHHQILLMPYELKIILKSSLFKKKFYTIISNCYWLLNIFLFYIKFAFIWENTFIITFTKTNTRIIRSKTRKILFVINNNKLIFSWKFYWITWRNWICLKFFYLQIKKSWNIKTKRNRYKYVSIRKRIDGNYL